MNNTLRLVICSLAAVVAGCGDENAKKLAEGVAQLEGFRFEFLWATQDAQGNLQLTHPADPAATRFTSLIHGRPLDHVVLTVQAQGSADQPLETGGQEYRLSHDDIQTRRGQSLTEKLQLTGQNGVQIHTMQTPSTGDTFPEPTAILIQTQDSQTVGQATSSGSIRVFFGAGGAVFKAEMAGGKIPWTVSNPQRDTFVEFELTQLDTAIQKAAGKFQCIARNESDRSDNRVLIIMHGDFAMKIE